MRFLFLILLSVFFSTVSHAAPKTFTITAPLGLNWMNELVHYPLSFAPGEWKGGPGVKVEAAGKAIPSQISDVMRHADGSMKSCNVWFFADVPANGSVQYTLTPGQKGPQENGVSIATVGDAITLSTLAPKPSAFDW